MKRRILVRMVSIAALVLGFMAVLHLFVPWIGHAILEQIGGAIGQQIGQQAADQFKQANQQFDAATVTVWVEGVRDIKEVKAKLEQAAGLDPKNRSVGYNHTGEVGMFKLAPVANVRAFAERIDFGRVLALDPEEKVVLVQYGGIPAPPPWNDGRFIRQWLPVTQTLNEQCGEVAGLAKEYGRDKVVTIRVSGLAPNTDAGHHAVREQLRPLLDAPAMGRFSPWALQEAGTYQFSVAPVSDVGRLAKSVTFGKVVSLDAERRVIFMQVDGIEKKDRQEAKMGANMKLPEATPDELKQMLARSLEEAYAGWSPVQRAIYLAVWRGHRRRSEIARYLRRPEEVVRQAMDDGMFGYLLWERAKPDPYVNFK